MATKGKKLESQGLSRQKLEEQEFEKQTLEELLRRLTKHGGRPRRMLGEIPYLLMEEQEPIASTIEPDRYLHILDSRGKIVDISIEEIKRRLAKMVQSIEDVAQTAATAARNIANKVGGGPRFELDEVTVALSIKAEADFIVLGGGGDVNLELKFVRRKGTGPEETS